MKTLFRALAFVIIAAAISLYSCQKAGSYDDQVPDTDIPDQPGKFVDNTVITSFKGRIMDENGLPMANAKVSINSLTTSSDQYGVFSLEGATAGKQFGLIKAEKTGYFTGFRTVLTRESQMNFVEIQLQKRELAGSFSSSSAASVTIQNRTVVEFPENSVVTEDGTAYNGEVQVYGRVIDPSAEDFAEIMPGDLRGVRTDRSITAMISYGMVSVDLNGDNGEKLQLAKGKTAILKMSISETLAASSPDAIPMWHFDENTGAWMEEGMGTKQGSMYVGKVAHFSTWNFDVPTDFIELTMQVVQPKSGPVPYSRVTIYDASNKANRNTALTDSSGKVTMWAPKNAQLKVNILGGCNEILDSKVFGPFEVNTDLGKISIQTSPKVIISGILLDCDSLPVTQGIVSLMFEGLNYSAFTEVDGRFTFQIDKCSMVGELPAVLHASDLAQMKKSGSKNITVELGENQVDEIFVCTEGTDIPSNTQFVKFRIGDQNYGFISPDDSAFAMSWSSHTVIAAFNPYDATPNTRILNLSIEDTSIGNSIFPGKYVTAVEDVSYSIAFTFDNEEQRYRVLLEDTLFLNTLKFEGIGGMIHVKFKTKVVLHGGNGDKLPVEGEARVRRVPN